MSDYPFLTSPRAAVEDTELTDGEYRILCALWTFKGKDGRVFPSTSKLAEMTGKSQDSIRRLLNGLKEKGWIEASSQYRDDGGQTSNNYTLKIDQDTAITGKNKGGPPGKNAGGGTGKNEGGSPLKNDTPISSSSSKSIQKEVKPPKPPVGGNGQKDFKGREKETNLDRPFVSLKKAPNSTQKAQLLACGFEYDSSTRTWSGPDTPGAHGLVEELRPHATRHSYGRQEAEADPATEGLQDEGEEVAAWREQLRDEVGERLYEIWWKPTAIQREGEQITVVVTTDFIRDFMLGKDMAQALDDLSGLPVFIQSLEEEAAR